MLHYIIIVKFDLINVPKICHSKSTKESFMSFSNVKRTCYTVKKNVFGYSILIRFYYNFFKCFHIELETLLYTFTKHFKC